MSHPSIDIDYVAELARIALSDADKKSIGAQLGNILTHMEALKSIDVRAVQPTAHAWPMFNVWREDAPAETFTSEQALKNAPAQRDHQLVVPQVVDTE